VLSTEQQGRLQTFQQLLYVEQDVEFLLVILDHAVADLDQKALDLFEEHKLGRMTNGARGLLLLVAPFCEQARIEVGYDLEGLLPDGFIAELEYEQMLPFFQQDRVGHGVEALTELLVARLLASGSGEVAANADSNYLSGGGGARISTSGSVKPFIPAVDIYLPQATPIATLELYRQVLSERIKDPELGIYTLGTRKFLREWLVTDGQQKNALKELDKVFSLAEVLIETDHC